MARRGRGKVRRLPTSLRIIWRGQRVLLVCEKRTALDVVADRLEHMGLRSLCGIVHDPQRDQRDLYRSIHQQLDELSDAKTNPQAQTLLEKVDAELKQLHDGLTEFHKRLMEPGTPGGAFFHDLMGRWMTYRSDYNVRIDAAGITADQLESNQKQLSEILRCAQRMWITRRIRGRSVRAFH